MKVLPNSFSQVICYFMSLNRKQAFYVIILPTLLPILYGYITTTKRKNLKRKGYESVRITKQYVFRNECLI